MFFFLHILGVILLSLDKFSALPCGYQDDMTSCTTTFSNPFIFPAVKFKCSTSCSSYSKITPNKCLCSDWLCFTELKLCLSFESIKSLLLLFIQTGRNCYLQGEMFSFGGHSALLCYLKNIFFPVVLLTCCLLLTGDVKITSSSCWVSTGHVTENSISTI